MDVSLIVNSAPRAAMMLAIGLAGALCAYGIGMPMPFLMGALASVGLYAGWRTSSGRTQAQFPAPLRKLFVAVIGVMIGASFTADLLASLPAIWPSLLVMLLYILCALGFGYVLFRRLGGYDTVTALYSSMPGGLVESVALGEEAGGDVRILALQHFARIVVVVVAVPFVYLVWSGNAVGSAGGQSFDSVGWTFWDVIELIALAIVGMWIGPLLRLPAPHMVGPLLLSAALHGVGLLHLASPAWLLALAQLVVGTGLGTSFSGVHWADLWRAFGLGLIYVGAVLFMGFGIATLLSPVLPFDFDTLFVSFAPGGVTEMGLIALSLGISPVIVTTHHIFRIVATVMFAGYLVRWLQR